MNEIMRFIPTRIEEKSGINLFVKQLCSNQSFYVSNSKIKKQVIKYDGDNFTLNYINYFMPVKFNLIYFNFFTSQIVDDFMSSNYFHIKGLVDVTDNELYDEENICEHSLYQNRFIVEGTKGVGKSCLIHDAILNGIICQDRDMSVISNDKYNHLPISIKAKACYDRIHQDEDEYLLIIKNTDKDELLRRINSRNISQEKDFYTEKFKDYSNIDKYIEQYNLLEQYLKEHHLCDHKIDIVDCTGLNKKEQQKKLFKCINSKQ